MTFVPHWTSGEDTYVTEPPDQLKSRGYIPDDVPTAEETNWVFRNLMPFRAFASEGDAASTLVAGQFGLITPREAAFGTSIASITLSTGSSTAYIATNGKQVAVVRSDGSGSTIGSLVAVGDETLTLQTLMDTVAYDGVADVSMDEEIVAAVCQSGNRLIVWSAVDGTLIGTVAVTGARRVLVHGRTIIVGTASGLTYGYKRDLSGEWWSGAAINHGDIINGIAAWGPYVMFSADATSGSGDTAAGTNVFVLSATDGTLVGEVSLDSGADMGPCVFSEGLWLVFGDNKLHSCRIGSTADPIEVANVAFTGGSSTPQVTSNGRIAVCGPYGFDTRSLSYIGVAGANSVSATSAMSLNTLFQWLSGTESLAMYDAPIKRSDGVRCRGSLAALAAPIGCEFPNLILQPL